MRVPVWLNPCIDILYLIGYVPSSIMIPQRRFSTLLHQAQTYQRQRCVYHNSPLDSAAFSLFEDHQCGKESFPGTTTAILDVHTNEVWNIEWSHDGSYLASASKDKTAIIWRIDVSGTMLSILLCRKRQVLILTADYFVDRQRSINT